MRARTCSEARLPLRGQNVILEESTGNRVDEGAPPVTSGKTHNFQAEAEERRSEAHAKPAGVTVSVLFLAYSV